LLFHRAAQKLNLSKWKKCQPLPPSPPDPEEPFFYTDGFSAALQLSPPPVPPCLLRAGSKVKDSPGMGKVKVMVRICPAKGSQDISESMSFLKVDGHKKQLTFCEPPTCARSTSATAPKTFTFDAVFTQDASQAEVCSGTVAEVIQSVVNGADGCIFCFGQANLGKSYTMIGRDSSTQSLGVAPCAISWLFKLIEERKEKTGTRFSIRVSAVEICGREELQNQSELRAYSAERAAFFLDAALAARSTSRSDCKEEDRQNSHMLFTLHISQYPMEKSTKAGMSGSHSRLHLLDLGSCESDLSQTRDGGRGQCLSMAALGNVILALANGAKHVPYRDSKLTMLLRESLGNINCRTTMIAHISESLANYAKSLTTVQLASRIHRMRKKKSKYASSSSGGESSCEEGHIRRRPFYPRTVALDPDHPAMLSSDPDYSSSSELSCDTVIYVGPGGTPISDHELSDNEGPPAFVPIIPSLNKKHVKEGPKSDGDHLKCNTFAELQERLECIDGSESTSVFTNEGKGQQTASKSGVERGSIVGNGNKGKALSSTGSKSFSSSTKFLAVSAARNASLPPTGKLPTCSVISSNAKQGRGTIMGTKQAIRAANSRVSELAVGSSKKHLRGSDQSDGNNDARTSSETPLAAPLPSPYSKITPPRHPQRYSSGHGSDNSSVLSGELPPAMGRTALFYHSGGSSGYESMIRDSETTGSASSAHDSMSESGVSRSSRTKASKSPKKRSNGLQRRRLIPAPLPDTSSLGRKVGAAGQWVDLPPLGGTMKEPFEIKVYEIDDVERLQRRKEGLTEGLQYFNARLRMLEKRQQQIREIRAKHEKLKKELEDAKTRLMLDPSKWIGEFDVDPDLDQESQDYLEALAQATGDLEFCVNLCKSCVMMETCFDIAVPAIPGQSGQQEMEV
ncbi:hypothetical protein cypCar_00022529, partial [Cyprinus carpio]